VPELPEVEIYRRYFARHALGQPVASVQVTDRRILHRATVPALRKALVGSSFHHTRRHGKHFFAQADTGWLYLHFGMTGDLHYGAAPKFSRLIITFENDAVLAFEDMRLFGRVGVVRDPDQFIREHRLGPDPLDPTFGAGGFAELLGRRRGAVKSLLMNQRNIAGLGNLWVDEILYQTGVHPRRSVEKIGRTKRQEMFRVMGRILNSAIERQERAASYPKNWLIENRDEGAECRRCGGRITRTVVFGRTTYYCAAHQRG
jgi:formamidopyrimidine-DNA glycosylase